MDEALDEIKESKCIFIPFEQVDGLTIRELYCTEELKNGFSFCAINKIDNVNFGNLCKINYTSINVLCSIFFPNQHKMQSSVLDTRIDKLVEMEIENRYSKTSDEVRQISNSYFEKYMDGDFSITNQRVKKLLNKN